MRKQRHSGEPFCHHGADVQLLVYPAINQAFDHGIHSCNIATTGLAISERSMTNMQLSTWTLACLLQKSQIMCLWL